MDDLIEKLKNEQSLAWKLTTGVLGAGADTEAARQARCGVKASPRVRALLEGGDRTQRAYKKWNGSHWVLSLLADLGYPPGEEALREMMEETFDCWLSEEHAQRHLQMIAGRARRCGSQEGNTIWSSLLLGFADSRTQELAERLMKWQWPDGGWNCDKRPEADTSSFMETLIPLRALALYALLSGDPRARKSAERAAEVFLSRRLFRRRSDGQVMDAHFLRLHYPCYWHYDILFGLKVLAEAGFLADPRCRDALDFLESLRLADGGFPAQESYSRTSRPELSGYSPADWGGVSLKRMNPFVTADALYVLRLAGRE